MRPGTKGVQNVVSRVIGRTPGARRARAEPVGGALPTRTKTSDVPAPDDSSHAIAPLIEECFGWSPPTIA